MSIILLIKKNNIYKICKLLIIMGLTSSSKKERKNENILEILKDIPNDQYACIECNTIPEIK